MKKLIEALKVLHESGFIYNDLKLDNIMIHRDSDSQDDDFNLVLIDYGFATEYLNNFGDHLPLEEMENFKGNLIFASEHTL